MRLNGYANPTPGYQAILREKQAALVVFEMMPEVAGFLTEFSGRIENLDRVAHNHGPVLAYRTWVGAWTVLDARVSWLLPAIDNYVEGETTC